MKANQKPNSDEPEPRQSPLPLRPQRAAASTWATTAKGAGRFSRRSEVSDEDYTELVRAALARTTSANRIHVSKVLPKSSSVGMARIDEDKAVEAEEGFAADMYPRSKSYIVAKNKPTFENPNFRRIIIIIIIIITIIMKIRR